MVVFALDGGSWNVLDPLMKRGLLPNLTRLRDGGASGVLYSFEPLTSPVVWTTIATGKIPKKHGITEFVRFPEGRLKGPRPVTRTLRIGKALWNILGEAGRTVGIVGWFVTWPVEQVNGWMISDRAHYRTVAQDTFPTDLLATVPPVGQREAIEAMPRFMDFEFDPSWARPSDADPDAQLAHTVSDRFIRAYARDLFYLRAARDVLARQPRPDFLALYLRGTDDVQHGFWKFMDPEPFGDVPEDHIQKCGSVIERYWQWMDEIVGEELARYDEPPLVLVVSDHGFGPALGRYAVLNKAHLHLSGAHRNEGVFIAHGPGIRAVGAVQGATTLDVTPTLLYYLGLPVAADMDGRVLMDVFEPAFTRDRPIREVASYDADDVDVTKARVVESAADDEILEHLRSLGYIE